MSWVEKEIEVLLYNLPNSDMQVEAIVKDETTLCPCDKFINNKECICGMYKKVEDEKERN